MAVSTGAVATTSICNDSSYEDCSDDKGFLVQHNILNIIIIMNVNLDPIILSVSESLIII